MSVGITVLPLETGSELRINISNPSMNSQVLLCKFAPPGGFHCAEALQPLELLAFYWIHYATELFRGRGSLA